MLYETFFEWLSSLKPGAASFVGSLTGFVLGLVALVLGALFNFWLNRRRDNALRREEMKAVAAALYGEIILLRPEVASLGRIVAKTYFQEGFSPRATLKFDETLLERNTLKDPVLYNSLASKLGLLPADMVLAVTKFHADYQAVRDWLPKLIENDKRGFSYSVLSLLKPADAAVLGVKPALRKFEALLHIEAPVSDPDMKDIGMAIDMENERFAGFEEEQKS